METETLTGLVRKAQEGDKHARQELYIDSGKSVYFLALKILRNKDDAEDITQDVFITVFEKLPTLKQPETFYKWINQITSNACFMLMRRKKPITMDEPDFMDALGMEDEDDTAPTPEKLYDDEETRRLILEIIDALPDAQRLCVLYRYFNQLSIEEIADITETNEHTVKSRLVLARQKIRAAILAKEEKEGIRLHVLIPIMPVLMKALEDFQMPEGLTARMWEKIAEGAGIAAGTAAASEAAKSGAKEAVKQSIKAKVIGGAAGAVAVAGIAAALLWPKTEPPAPVTPPPNSAPAISQPAPSAPEPIDDTIIFNDPVIESLIREALGLSPDDEVPQDDLNGIKIVSIDRGRGENQYNFGIGLYPDVSFKKEIEVSAPLDLSDLARFQRLESLMFRETPPISDYSVFRQLSDHLMYFYLFNATDLTELPSFGEYDSLIGFHLSGCPNLTKLPDFGDIKEVDYFEVKACGITDITSLSHLTDMASVTIQDCPLIDISPLTTWEKARTLNLKNCQITDPSVLADLPILELLILTGNPISDTGVFDSFTDVEIDF